MKTFLEKLKRLAKNELVCLSSIIVSLIYSVYYMGLRNPLEYSLSEIGRTYTALFIVWSLLVATAFFLNVNRLYERTGFKSKLGKGLMYAGLIFLVLTFVNMKKDPIIFYHIHVVTAILFSVLSFASAAICLVSVAKKSKVYLITTIVLFSIVFIDIIFLIIYKQMALFESVPLISTYIVLIFTNFTSTFKLNKL